MNSEAKTTANREAGHMRSETQNAAGDLGSDVKDQARAVTDEAAAQAKSLASSMADEATTQASAQQERLAGQARIISDDLDRMARGEQAESDLVNRFISEASEQARRITEHLENREPRELLDDVRSFAARRPGMFFAIAAGLGIAAGRLTRGIRDSDNGADTSVSRPDLDAGSVGARAGVEYGSGTAPHLDPSMDYDGRIAPGTDPTAGATTSGTPTIPTGSPNVDAPTSGFGEPGRHA